MTTTPPRMMATTYLAPLGTRGPLTLAHRATSSLLTTPYLVALAHSGGNPGLLSAYLRGRASTGEPDWVEWLLDDWGDNDPDMASAVFDATWRLGGSDAGAARSPFRADRRRQRLLAPRRGAQRRTSDRWVRGVPGSGHGVGTPAPVPQLWVCRLLQQLRGQARPRPLRADRPSDRPFARTRRDLELVLDRRDRGVGSGRFARTRDSSARGTLPVR